jgi:hypothetical protein
MYNPLQRNVGSKQTAYPLTVEDLTIGKCRQGPAWASNARKGKVVKDPLNDGVDLTQRVFATTALLRHYSLR